MLLLFHTFLQSLALFYLPLLNHKRSLENSDPISIEITAIKPLAPTLLILSYYLSLPLPFYLIILGLVLWMFDIWYIGILLWGIGLAGSKELRWIQLSGSASENFINIYRKWDILIWSIGGLVINALVWMVGRREWGILLILLFGTLTIDRWVKKGGWVEGVQWLVKDQKWDEAKAALKEIGRVNERPVFNFRFEEEVDANVGIVFFYLFI